MSLTSSLGRATIASASTTRILLLPMDNIARVDYEACVTALRRLGSVIPMSALTYHAPSKDTPFKTVNWRRGQMLFEFIDGSVPAEEADSSQLALSPIGVSKQETDVIANQFDDVLPPVPMVASPSTLTLNYDWDELHVYAKIMGVICICHAPTANMEIVKQQFQDVRAQLLHPGGPFIYKCYAFECDATHKQADPRENWSFIPSPDADTVNPSSDNDDGQAHVDFFLQTCLYQLASGLLDNFEASIKKLPPHADLKSPLEAASTVLDGGLVSSQGSNSSEQYARAKKLRPGRQKKYVGDYCLLATDATTALKHFKAAVDACKSAGDSIWHAGAVEGQAACYAMLEQEKEISAPMFLETVVDLYEETLLLLSRVPYASVLSIEASFKLARYLMQWDRKCEAQEVLMRMYALKMDCSAHDQISLAVEAAILCHQLGFKRKYGFFLVQAAGLYRELHQSASCHALLRMASAVFRLDGFSKSVLGPEPTDDDDPSSSALDSSDLRLWSRLLLDSSLCDPLAYRRKLEEMQPAKRRERGWRVGRWVAVQKSVLEHLVFSAKQMQDDILTASCTSYLLRTLYPWLDQVYQISIVRDLWSCTRLLPLNISTIDMTGLPVVHSLRPVEASAELAPWVDPPGGADAEDRDTEEGVGQEDQQLAGMGSCARIRRAEAALHGDVFLSRPDEDPRSQPAKKLKFVASEPMDVEVLLSNPLAVPLQVQHLSLSTSGIAFEAFPVSFTLQPGTVGQRVLLSGIPLEEGTLKVEGLHIRIFNTMWHHPVTAHGEGIRPDYADGDSSTYFIKPPSTNQGRVDVRAIEILPPLPKLNLAYSVSGNLASSFLLGEEREAQLVLHNVGPLPVENLDLYVEQQFVAMSAHSQAVYYMQPDELAEIKRNTQAKLPAATPSKKSLFSPGGRTDAIAGTPMRKTTDRAEMTPSMRRRFSSIDDPAASPSAGTSAPLTSPPAPKPTTITRRLVTFDPEALKSQLPLKPGGILSLTIKIIAHVDCCGAKFTISYGAPSSRMFRCLEYPVAWKVQQGLQLNHLHVYHFITPTSSSTRLSPASHTGPSALSLTSSSTSSSSAITGGHLADELGMMTAGDCMLILELTNSSSTTHFRLTCTVNGKPYKTHSLLIDKQSEKRLILPLPRISFGSHVDDEYLRRLAHSIAEDSSTAPASWSSDSTFVRLLARFHERVKLTWTSSEESHGSLVGMGAQTGQASVEITPMHLYRLLPDPIDFQTELAVIDPPGERDQSPDVGSPVFLSPKLNPSASPSGGVTAREPLPVLSSGTRALVGSFHRLTVRMVNQTANDLGALELTVRPFQESVNGQLDTQLQHKMLLVGTLTKRFDHAAPGALLEHSILVCFTSVGRFNFQIVAKQQHQRTQQASSVVKSSFPAASSSLDPFSILGSIAAAASAVMPAPVHSTSTVRRRSVVQATDAEAAAAASATNVSRDFGVAGGYQLDLNSDDDEDEVENFVSFSAMSRPTVTPKQLVYRCPHVLVVQAAAAAGV